MPLDVTALITDCYSFLHAQGAADVVFSSDGELTRGFADYLKKLAEIYGVFLLRDTTSITFVSGQQFYAAPPRHLATVHISYQGLPLNAASTRELEAYDDNYQATAATASGTKPGPVSRFFEDKSGANQIGFYPVPAAADAGNHPEVIYWGFPCDIQENHLVVAVNTPAVVGDMLEFQVVSDQYRKESDFEAPEIAQACDQLSQLYQQGIKALWGPDQ